MMATSCPFGRKNDAKEFRRHGPGDAMRNFRHFGELDVSALLQNDFDFFLSRQFAGDFFQSGIL